MIAVTGNSKDKATSGSTSDLLARLALLEAENAKLKEARHKSLSLKVSTKQAVSLYGCGRYPVTLYKSQWLRVLDMADTIRQFIKDHPELAEKA